LTIATIDSNDSLIPETGNQPPDGLIGFIPIVPDDGPSPAWHDENKWKTTIVMVRTKILILVI